LFRHIIVAESALPGIKPAVWIGSARTDVRAFPEEVKDLIGFALNVAQQGGKHPDTKPLRGFGGAGVLEIIEDHRGDTYRAVYTVRLAGRAYVLHAFQKKSKYGIQTPKAEINLIKSRLKRAEEEHAAWLERNKGSQEHG
jgi:phage-related protein